MFKCATCDRKTSAQFKPNKVFIKRADGSIAKELLICNCCKREEKDNAIQTLADNAAAPGGYISKILLWDKYKILVHPTDAALFAISH
jgi:hypothetical protein